MGGGNRKGQHTLHHLGSWVRVREAIIARRHEISVVVVVVVVLGEHYRLIIFIKYKLDHH